MIVHYITISLRISIVLFEFLSKICIIDNREKKFEKFPNGRRLISSEYLQPASSFTVLGRLYPTDKSIREAPKGTPLIDGARDSVCSVGYRRFRLRIVTSWRTPDQRHAQKTVRRTVFLTGFRVPSHSFIPMKKTPLTGAFFMELEMGLEPTTYWLRNELFSFRAVL